MARRALRIVHYTDEELHTRFFDVFDVNKKQWNFIAGSKRRFQLFCGGRGTGKTFSLMLKALFLALMNPGMKGAVLGRTHVDNDDTLIPQFEEHLDQWKRVTGVDLVQSYNKATKTYTLINGAKVIFRSYGRIKKVRGKTYAWICVDEIEHIEGVPPQEAFNVMSACLRGLKKARLKCFAMATTPDGLKGVIRHFKDRLDAGDKTYLVIRSTMHDAVDHGFMSQEDLDAFKSSCSKAQWEQEGLGIVLKPEAAVFREYSESKHVKTWRWDESLPYLIGVDWGEAHAYFCVVQVVTRNEYRNSGHTYRAGDWIVAYEEKHEQTNRGAFREAIHAFIKQQGRLPTMMAGDRAIPSEQSALRQAYPTVAVRDCQTKADQSIRNGVEMVRYMLDPMEGEPRLYLAEKLPNSPNPVGRGLRWSLLEYRNKRNAEGQITNQPYKDDLNDHPVDALRYLVRTSCRYEALHGGRKLPYVNPHSREQDLLDLERIEADYARAA